MANGLNIPQGAEALKHFQLDNISISDKSDTEYGLAISKYISSTVYAGLGGYYFDRNARFLKNRNYANGRLDVKAMFSDRFDYNGKQNYINIGWQAVQIVNRIISGLVGRWMGRNEKIQVKAVDSLSIKQKEEQYKDVEYYVYNQAMLLKMQQEAGEQLLPQTEIPKNQDELDIWKHQFQKLPEEIEIEMTCNDVMEANGLYGVIKEKLLHDEAEVGLIGTYTWMDKEGVIHTDYCKPENMIYSYSEYPDFRDTTFRGVAPTMKISEIRKNYGVEFGGKLTEKELWEIAETSKNFQKFDNITWLDQWASAYMRPYDEWNVDSIQFELKSVDKDRYTVSTTTKNKSVIVKKGNNVKKTATDEVIEDTNWNIYRGVYLPKSEKLLEWGLKKNMIRPQDPKEIGNAEFSYSFYMYQNYRMRNIAIPEKIEQPVNGMILSVLKIEQVIAKSRPPGAAINTRALQAIDFGLGDKKNKEIDQKKLYDQTGDLYYYDLDADGKPIPIPIQEIPNTAFQAAIAAHIQSYQFYYGQLRDQLGEDPNLMSQALQPRVTAQNVNSSERAAENSTDYGYDGYLYLMEDTAKKVTCLLKNSVIFGAKAYRDLMKEDQIKGRIYSAVAKMLPTEQEIAVLDAQMNQAIASNPDLPLYLNTFKVLRIAKEDVKLAEQYYHDSMRKMLESKMQQSQQNMQQTIDGQMASAKSAEEEKRKSLEMELDIKKQISDSETANDLKKSMVAGLFSIYAKGIPVPPELKGLESEVITNVGLPLFAENINNVQSMMQQGEGEEGEGQQEQMKEDQQGEQQEQMQQQPQQVAA